MKNTLIILNLLFFFPLSAQKTLSVTEWQEDLRFIQNTIHKDYSFLFVKTTKQEFDTRVETLYNDIPNLESHEIKVGITRLIASFKYGHTCPHTEVLSTRMRIGWMLETNLPPLCI